VNEAFRVLIVSERVVVRQLLTELMGGFNEVAQAQAAASGRLALARLCRGATDLVLFDLESDDPHVLSTLSAIREAQPQASLILIDRRDSGNPDLTIKALETGALDVLTRPAGRGDERGVEEFRQEVNLLLRGVRARRNTQLVQKLTQRGLAPTPEQAPRVFPAMRLVTLPKFQMVAIGASTGGPNALRRVLPTLPADLSLPVLIVQHLPASFTTALAENLHKVSTLPVQEARDGEPLLPNRVYLSPGGRHLTVARSKDPADQVVRVQLTDGPKVNSCKPSADVLFQSVAEVYGGGVLAVVLTGMGNDGQAGVAAVKVKGGYCLSQSEETCAVYGMPRAVDEAGLSDERPHLDQIGLRIACLTGHGPRT
jgi:two-component system chemotaxis response regulator CheB